MAVSENVGEVQVYKPMMEVYACGLYWDHKFENVLKFGVTE